MLESLSRTERDRIHAAFDEIARVCGDRLDAHFASLAKQKQALMRQIRNQESWLACIHTKRLIPAGRPVSVPLDALVTSGGALQRLWDLADASRASLASATTAALAATTAAQRAVAPASVRGLMDADDAATDGGGGGGDDAASVESEPIDADAGSAAGAALPAGTSAATPGDVSINVGGAFRGPAAGAGAAGTFDAAGDGVGVLRRPDGGLELKEENHRPWCAGLVFLILADVILTVVLKLLL
jgi:hypothetical protein